MRSLIIMGVVGALSCMAQEQNAYIGTYTGSSGSKGVYRIRVDNATGVATKPELVAEVGNPSFLALDAAKHRLYAVSESASKVFAYSIGDTALTLLNEAKTGAGPCHVAVHVDGKLAVADYGGGSVSTWQIGSDGRIGEQTAFFQNAHASKATSRQDKPRAHGVTFSPDGKLLLVPDLGADRVYVYGNRDTPTAHKVAPWIELPPGRGPRHVAFSENHLYVINELSNTVSVFGCDWGRGLFTFVEEVSTLPAGFTGESTTAELIVTGNALYATNRGHDSIARFKRDSKTGRLTLMECVPCGGKWPRHFSLIPGAPWLLVANQNSNSIAVFRVEEDGALTLKPENSIEIPAPVCVVF